MSFRIALFFTAIVLWCAPHAAIAHEVYVLTPEQISIDTAAPGFDEVAVILADVAHFVFWALISMATVLAIFFISIIRSFERIAWPLLNGLRRYGAPVARITIGISFLAAAYNGAAYGPELPLAAAFGPVTIFVQGLLVVLGLCIIFGFYTRLAALVALALFGVAVHGHGAYMLTYANYFGEFILLMILGAHHGASPRTPRKEHKERAELLGLAPLIEPVAKRFAPYSFAVLRVCFGIALLYASLYAKVIHNNLALSVATLPLAGHSVGVAHYFGLEPHFLVLGAAIIEIVIALFFILGVEIRFTSLFLLFWLSLSLFYFGEVVWPHVVLIGIPIAFIFYGYDPYSLEGHFFKKNGREPVL